MAYALKYFWEKTVDNKVYRLEIHEKNSTSAAMEIGDVVQGLSLNIDGGEDNLDSPLLTSSLVMTFVDAYDHPESLIKKCGNWAEFYTPDATMWKVLLSVYSEGDGTIALWGGYVTPDSYEEDLTYGGSVTITARDNIGHLNDFSFDAEGNTITLRELVESAWAKIESPMRLTWANEWLQCDGVDAPDTYMNVSAFTGDTWHKAVEKALYGYGAVLRYKGENEVVICPLKSIPTVMPASSREQEPIFVAGATRLLTPAVKKIEESADYEIEAITAEPIKDSDYTGETDKFLVEGYSAAEKGVAWNVDKKESGFGWCAPELSLFFNAKAYSLYNEDYRQDLNYMFLCCNTYRGAFTGKGTRYAEYSRYINASDVTFQMRLGTPYRLVDFDYLLSTYYSNVNYTSCLVAVKVVQNGITNYLQPDKTWGVSEAVVTCDISGGSLELPISLSPYEGSVLLCIQIVHIFTTDAEYKAANYAPVYSAGISIDNGSVLAKNNVNTVYSEQNNVVITRSPEIAPSYNIVALPEIIKNGIFRKVGDAYQPARQWAWQGFTPQQLAVYNHLQLLCYYAKPNNILEGTITNGDLFLYGNIWKWEGKEHILVAGRYDILTGYIDGAILREFARYENMWGDIGGVGFPDVEASSANRAEVGASSSSSNPNTYTNTTTVNIGTGGGGSGASYLNDLEDVDVNGVVAGSVLWFDGSNWIDRSLSVMLEPYAKAEDLRKVLDWFTLEDDVLLTKYNLASEKEVSAKGINASQGGGTSYNRLDSWSAYDSTKAGYVLSALLGYDLHSRVTNLENTEVDLSDYYTKSQTNSQIASAIGAIDLSPYATKEALSTLEGKHNTLRNEFDALNNLLSSDTTDYINTWNEVVAFLDGYKDESDLATILSGMNADISSRLLTSTFESWKADTYTPLANLVANHTTRLNGLDQSILSINTRIDGVDTTIEDHIAEFIAFRDNFEITDNLILVKKNFASTKEISAHGINQGNGGGGSSFSRLDAWADYDSNKAGYVLSALLGYDLHSRVTVLENKEVDLSNYYTKEQTDNRISAAISKIDFTPYAKVNDVANTYATIAALTLIDGRVESLESAGYATEGYVNAAISKIDFTPYATNDALSKLGEDVQLRLLSSEFATWETNTFTPLAIRVSQAEEDIDTNATNIAKANNNISTLDALTKQHSTKIAANEENIGTKADQSSLDAAVKDIATNAEDIIKANKNISNLDNLTKEHASQISGLETRVTVAEGNIANHDSEIDNLDKRIKTFESWFELVDGNIKTTFNFYSTKQISALGLEAGNGGGGSSYSRLDSWSAYDSSKAGYVLSALLGQDLNTRLIAVENKEVDLTGYYTKAQTDAKISSAVSAIDFTPYAKSADVAKTYATIAALNLIDGRVGNLEKAGYATTGYVDAAISGIDFSPYATTEELNEAIEGIDLTPFAKSADVALTYATKNELTASINGLNISQYAKSSDVEATYATKEALTSAINGLNISQYATTAALDKAISDLNISQYAKSTDVASTYATIAALSGLTDLHNNLRSEFDALNSLLNDDTAGVIDTWNEVVDFINEYSGSDDLETILAGMNKNIDLRLLASDFNAWVANTYTPLAYRVGVAEENIGKNATAIANNKSDIDKLLGWFKIDSDGNVYTEHNFYSTQQISAKGLNAGGGSGSSYNRLDAWTDYDSNKAGYVLSASLGYGLKVAIDELNGYDLDNRVRSIENSYVSKDAGGVVNGGLVVSSLAISGGSSSQFLKADGSLDSTSYLSTAGGTISNGIWAYQLNLNALNTDAGLRFSINGALKGLLRVDSNQDLWYQGASENLLLHSGNVGEYALSTSGGKIAVNSGIQWGDTNNVIYATASTMHIDTDSNLFINGKQVIHEGNVGSYNAGGLMTGASHLYAQHNDTDKYIVFGYQTARNGYSTTIDGTSITFRDGGSNPTMLINSAGNVTIGDRDKAITSAKLYVDGTIIGGSVGTSTLGWDANTNTGLCVTSNGIAGWVSEFGNGTQGVLLGCRGESQNVASIGSVGGTTLALNPDSGNVGIGTTDPQAKLHVNGVTRIQRDYDPRSYLDIAVDDISVNYNGYDTDGWCSHYFNSNGITRMAIIGLNGYVGIGTTSPSYKLHVEGTGYFSGALTANGGLTVNGTLSVGNASIHPANGTPYFQLYQNNNYWYWQAENDYMYIGGTVAKAMRLDQDGNTLIRGSLGVTGDATANRLVVGTDGISCNGPATFNDFIYGSSITPRTDNYYVLGNNNYKWYAVTAYNVNVHDAITIEAGKELRFKDNNGEVHTLKYDSTKQAFVFDGNVNATGEISAKKLNA